MVLVLIIILFFTLGGGGYYGYHKDYYGGGPARHAPDRGIACRADWRSALWLVLPLIASFLHNHAKDHT
jgi:hypothetical protein